MQSNNSLTSALDRLGNHIASVPCQLGALSEIELTHCDPGKWSRKQILGHLIDSAVNNLKRFTDAQLADGVYLIQSYNQEHLVTVNHYQDLPIEHLLLLWQCLNRQILYVAQSIPENGLLKPIQFSPFADTKTVGWLIKDYVIHLEHHLKTLL